MFLRSLILKLTKQVLYFLDKYTHMREKKIIQNTNPCLKKKRQKEAVKQMFHLKTCNYERQKIYSMQYVTICIDLVHNFLVFTLEKKTNVYKSLHPLYKKLQLKPGILHVPLSTLNIK